MRVFTFIRWIPNVYMDIYVFQYFVALSAIENSRNANGDRTLNEKRLEPQSSSTHVELYDRLAERKNKLQMRTRTLGRRRHHTNIKRKKHELAGTRMEIDWHNERCTELETRR